MHPLIQIPVGTYAVLRRVTAECRFIVPLTPQFLQLNTCSSCPSLLWIFFSSSSVYVTVPTIKSSLTLLPATLGCGYQLCFVTNRFMKLSYCLLSFCSVSPASFLQKKIKKENRFMLCTVQNIGLRILFKRTITLKNSLQGRD